LFQIRLINQTKKKRILIMASQDGFGIMKVNMNNNIINSSNLFKQQNLPTSQQQPYQQQLYQSAQQPQYQSQTQPYGNFGYSQQQQQQQTSSMMGPDRQGTPSNMMSPLNVMSETGYMNGHQSLGRAGQPMGQQMGGQQMGGQQMGGQQMGGQQIGGQQMGSQQMGSQQIGSQSMGGQQMSGQQISGQSLSGQQMGTTDSKLDQDRKRVALVLEINQELLSITINWANDSNKDSPDSTYMLCMKRLQCNLAYLASLADRGKSLPASAAYPQILSAPPEVASLVEPYRRLQQLFPEVVAYMQQQLAMKQRQAQAQAQQQAQQAQSHGMNLQNLQQQQYY
jgi:hypothetical protein